MTRKILIITNRNDIHADIVAEKVSALGSSYYRLNIEEFPRDYRLTCHMRHGEFRGELVHTPSNKELELSQVGAVWLRRLGEFSFSSANLSAHERAFAKAETAHVIYSILSSLNCYWMSDPSQMRQAQWKGEQLLRAARMGFAVPPSIISNSPDAVASFRTLMELDIVFKSLSSPSLEAHRVLPDERIADGLPTTRITDDIDLDAVREIPCFFQRYIAKRHEVRATVIGDAVYAARIHSQDDPRTATDYRDFSAEIKYEIETLPRDVERRCIDFVHSYGLNFGAIDLIVTPDEQYVFLENNPAGQFLFIEQLVPELKLTDALAAKLVEGAQSVERH